jgi:hypothetical protein
MKKRQRRARIKHEELYRKSDRLLAECRQAFVSRTFEPPSMEIIAECPFEIASEGIGEQQTPEYRPYVWMGDDQDAHVRDYRRIDYSLERECGYATTTQMAAYQAEHLSLCQAGKLFPQYLEGRPRRTSSIGRGPPGNLHMV